MGKDRMIESTGAFRGSFTVRLYRSSDRDGVRRLEAEDLYERPRLLNRYPELGEFRADGLAHYYDLEPESCFVAVAEVEIIGNVLGTVDARIAERRAERFTRRLRRRRMLRGGYGFPLFLLPILRTERASPISDPPRVDSKTYPAELHIGVREAWQRRGVGRALVAAFEGYLASRGIPGYRVYVSSYHYKGVAFFRRLGLDELGTFLWRLYDGFDWRTVTEHVFVRRVSPGA